MKKIVVPGSYNYVSAFLTFACTFKCSYCINKYNGLHEYDSISAADWIIGINRIITRKDLPITITGGEPTVYKGFYDLVCGIDKEINIDLLTNGDFDAARFMQEIPPERMKRDAPYASIRFSYHPGYTRVTKLMIYVNMMRIKGYSVGIWAVDTGEKYIERIQLIAESYGIDLRLKELLDKTHGNYKYPAAVDGIRKKCLCKPSEMLIAPDGRIFRCHYDLYHGINSYAHILDEEVKLPEDFMPCDNYGLCNPCDIKAKFNRFQELGHCSVTIKESNEEQN